MPDVIPIEQLLIAAGFDRPDAITRAREVLEAHGLTRAGKQAIASAKVASVEAALSAALVRVCSERCLRIDREDEGVAREAVRVSPPSCEICAGSNNRRAAIECARTLRRKGVKRVVVVGGTAALRQELGGLLSGDGIAIRFVDGTSASHSAKDALANTRWAQLIVVWAPTPLRHAVSDLYSRERAPHARVVTVNRRGIEALCAEIVRSYT